MTATVEIDASAAATWQALTDPNKMKIWMADDEIEIKTDWQIGHLFVITGNLHGVSFENKGRVLQYQPQHRLSYTHLSSISELPDHPENDSIITFTLDANPARTTVSVNLSGFPNLVIQKHLAFYWRGALVNLKRYLEEQDTTPIKPRYPVAPL